MILVYDTETAGLPDFRAPSAAPHQPHIVQLAAILCDSGGRERAAINVIVRPDGWTIPDDVAAIHGIDQATAEAFGIPEQTAVLLFMALDRQAHTHVAHNIGFDRRILRIAMLRTGLLREDCETVEAKTAVCTMRQTIGMLNLPPTARMQAAGFNGPKQPKLAECIKHFFDEDLTGAHDAMVDVRACARVFFHLETLRAAA